MLARTVRYPVIRLVCSTRAYSNDHINSGAFKKKEKGEEESYIHKHEQESLRILQQKLAEQEKNAEQEKKRLSELLQKEREVNWDLNLSKNFS